MSSNKTSVVYKWFVVWMILPFLSLSGCGGAGSAPSSDDARMEFVSSGEFSKEIENGITKVSQFEKVNGQASEIFGVKVYSIMYEAEIEYLQSQPKINPFTSSDPNIFESIRKCERSNGKSGKGCIDRAAGDKITTQGEIQFEQTENGWKGESGSIY